jgi:DNA polymerase-1
VIVTTEEQFRVALDRLRGTGPLVLDCESNGLHMFARENPARMIGVAVGLLEDESTDAYFVFRHGEGDNLPVTLIDELRLVIEGRELVGHNIGGFDLRLLWCDGFALPPKIQDTMISAFLVNEEEDSLALKTLGEKYLGAGAADEEQALYDELRKRGFRGKEAKGEMYRLSGALVGGYGIKDIRLARQLLAFYAPLLERWRLTGLCAERNEQRLALTRMELLGLPIDLEELHRQRAAVGPRLKEIEQEVNRLAGREINLNAPGQVCAWLGIPSSRAEVLQEMVERDHDGRALLVLEHRQLSKAESGFFVPLEQKASAQNIVHSSFNNARVVTQRLCSSDPNAQQFSKNSSKRKYSVRNLFVPPPGCFWVDIDLSAIEPRVAAGYSKDPGMIEAFKQNLDVHARAARAVFRKQDITEEERSDAKTLSLGVLYFLGAHKAARELGLRHDKDANGKWVFHHDLAWTFQNEQLVQVPCSTISEEFCTCEGRQYINNFHDGWPQLKPFMKACTKQAETFGYIRIPLTGAVRRFPDRRWAHKAFNSCIQMTAGEILRRAFMRMDKEFSGPDDPKIHLTVHDSIVLAVKYGPNAWAQVKRAKEIMETTTEWPVPTVSEVKVGLSLGNLGRVDV